jgi:hypothetical protein
LYRLCASATLKLLLKLGSCLFHNPFGGKN